MASSVAVLSDIHGVMPALDAVVAEPDLQRAGRIVLTGDIAAGPLPTDVLDRLLDLGDTVVWVRGNADRELVELARQGWAFKLKRPGGLTDPGASGDRAREARL